MCVSFYLRTIFFKNVQNTAPHCCDASFPGPPLKIFEDHCHNMISGVINTSRAFRLKNNPDFFYLEETKNELTGTKVSIKSVKKQWTNKNDQNMTRYAYGQKSSKYR